MAVHLSKGSKVRRITCLNIVKYEWGEILRINRRWREKIHCRQLKNMEILRNITLPLTPLTHSHIVNPPPRSVRDSGPGSSDGKFRDTVTSQDSPKTVFLLSWTWVYCLNWSCASSRHSSRHLATTQNFAHAILFKVVISITWNYICAELLDRSYVM